MKNVVALILLSFCLGANAADLIVVCSGSLSINADDTVSCDNWQPVSYEVSPFNISDTDRDDFILAASGFLVTCFAGRMLIKNLNPTGILKGD